MRVLLLCALFALAQSQSVNSIDGQYQWELFKVEHMKEYRSETEEQHRKDIFLSNLKSIREHNAKYKNGEVSFDVEVNQFADMTHEEIMERMNGLRISEDYERLGEEFTPGNSLELPKSIDWRKKGAVTNVKFQGNCFSCWAFSATGALEGQWFLKTKKLVSLSEQNLVDCPEEKYRTNGCSGAYSLHGAFDYIKDNKGIDTEESYPYEGRVEKCRYNPKTIGATVTGYVYIKNGSEEDLQKAVANIGPISVGVDSKPLTFNQYRTGIYRDPKCSSTKLNHAVLVVGYGTDSNGEDYWLVKNSWSREWGMNGYMMLARNENNMCGIGTIGIYPKV